jgi:hypothetical protein
MYVMRSVRVYSSIWVPHAWMGAPGMELFVCYIYVCVYAGMGVCMDDGRMFDTSGHGL